MATELSMNGKKKIETIQKEFSNKFPFLTLIFLNEKRESIDVSKTLSEIRKSKGDDISIIASLKVNNLEKKFLKNYGLIVEVAYQKEGEVVMTQPDEEKTLNELNNWCELNGCSKIRYQGTSKVPQKVPNVPEVSGNKLFEEDHISYTEEKLEAIKKAIKVLRDPSFGDKSVEVEIYTQDFVSRDTLEKCEVEGRSILIKRTNWWEDSSWVSIHTKESAIEILLNLYKYGTYEGLNEPEVSWRFENSGKHDNGCDLEVLNSAEFYMVKNILPDEVLTDEDEIDVWELRDYYGYSEQTVDKVDFEDIEFESILFKLGGQELLLIPSEINDLVSSGREVAQNDSENKNFLFSDEFIDQAIAEHNSHEDGFDVDFKEAEIDPVLEIVKDKLVEYCSDIVVNSIINSNSISFKLPFVSKDDKSLLILSLDQGMYQMKFQCFDEKLVEELIAFKPDVIKKYTSGVAKDDLCKNEGELFSAVVDFICLLSRTKMDLGDGTLIHYIGYNKYSKEINGVGQFQVSGDAEASIFSIYDHYEIDSQKWMRLNLQTSFFRNGELIKQAKTEAEWLWAIENKVPAWCYYNNDPANGTKYGYLYNWYAINDPRGLAPKGWKIPSQQEYQKLVDYFKTPQPGVGIQLKPAGYRLNTSAFKFIDQIGFWWTSDEDGENARFATFAEERSDLSFGSGLKSLGLSVICIGESLISEGLQELIDEGIAVNLYRNPRMLDTLYFFANEAEITENVKKYGSMFLDHLFAIPFKSDTKGVVDKVFKFLDKQLKVDYKSLMFKTGLHHPVLGIYNAASNELLRLGIGRKNRIFFVSTVKTINDQNYTSFSNFDYCKVISTTKWLLERAADAQIGIMDAIEEGDSESEEDYSKSLEESMNDLLIAYPNLPNSIGDLSPGDL